MPDKLDVKKSKGFRARLKGLHPRSGHHTNPVIDGVSEGTTPVLTEAPPRSLRRPDGIEDANNHTKLDSPKTHQRSRRQEAEAELKAAAATLNRAMSNVSQPVQAPEALTLEDIDEVDDVERMAREIGKTMDKFIDNRMFKMTSQSRAVWKDCVKRWFLAAFPYVKPCVDVVNQSVPSPYGIVVSGVLFILQTLYDAGTLATEVEDTIRALSDTIRDTEVTEGFKDILDEKQLDEVYCAALRLSAAIAEYLAKAILCLEGETLKNLFSSPAFAAAKERINIAANAYMKSMGFLTAKMTAQLLLHNKNEEREKILNWLWSGDDINWRRHWDIHRRRAQGTGKWFLDSAQFKDWRKGIGSPVLFCPGIPGAGKSFMTSKVVDHLLPVTNNLNRHKTAVLVVYFQYDARNLQTCENILRTLCKQIVYQLDAIPDSVQMAYNRSSGGMSLVIDTTDFFSIFAECLLKFSTAFLMIDALDECAEDERVALVKTLQPIFGPQLRGFVTSRPHVRETPDFWEDDELQRWLQNAKILEIVASPDDIAIFLEEQFKAIKRCDENLKRKVIMSIGTKAQGQFLLANLQLKYLLDFLCQPRKLEKALERMPATAGNLYDEVMRRIGEGGTTSQDLALRTLSWIFHTAKTRALKMNELREMLVIEEGDTELNECQSSAEDIIAVCQSLVICDPQSKVVRFSHFTVQEFLAERYYDKLLPRVELAKVCLTYITFDVFAKGPCLNAELFNMRSKIYQSYDHAVQYWGSYMKGPGEENPQILNKLLQLFKTPQKCSALRQQQLLLHESWEPSEIWKLSSSEDLWTWKPIHIMAHEGLSNFYSLISSGRREVSISGTEASGDNHEFQKVQIGTVSSRDSFASTALIEAATGGHKDMVVVLLKDGADVKAQSVYGGTALHCAAAAGHAEVVKLLLDANAEPSVPRDPEGLTPMHDAVKGGSVEVMAFLKSAGAGYSEYTYDERTPIHIAAVYGSVDAISMMCQEGVDIEKRSKSWNMTPMHYAAGFGRCDSVEALHDGGGNIFADFGGDSGYCSIHHAARFGQPAVIELLKDLGVNISTRTTDGSTPMHYAADYGHIDAIRTLKALGADGDLQAKAVDGRIPRDRAQDAGQMDVVRYLDMLC